MRTLKTRDQLWLSESVQKKLLVEVLRPQLDQTAPDRELREQWFLQAADQCVQNARRARLLLGESGQRYRPARRGAAIRRISRAVSKFESAIKTFEADYPSMSYGLSRAGKLAKEAVAELEMYAPKRGSQSNHYGATLWRGAARVLVSAKVEPRVGSPFENPQRPATAPLARLGRILHEAIMDSLPESERSESDEEPPDQASYAPSKAEIERWQRGEFEVYDHHLPIGGK